MKRWLITIIVLAVTLVTAFLPTPLGSGVAPSSAQSGTYWNAQYYDNPYLSGNPVIQRTEGSLALNWGGGSPGGGVPVDNWSARFATDTYFSAGSYRFYILADDGVKLWIDFPPEQRPTIDSYTATRPGETLTADVTLTEGSHHIQVDFRENSGNAYLYVRWERISASMSGPNFPPAPAPIPSSGSWTAQYFNNSSLAGSPVATFNEASPSHNWGNGAPVNGVGADNWSARWSTVQPLSAGTYQITMRADDGVRVYIAGVLSLNEWHGATGQTYTTTFSVASGQHNITVEYYDATMAAYLEYSLTNTTAPPPATGATARVLAYVLNVRNAPLTGSIITKVRAGESYAVVGRNQDSSWWQINVNGTVGWVSGRYVTVTNASAVPATNTAGIPAPQPTVPSYVYGQCPGFLPSRLAATSYGRVTPGLANNIRAQPSISSTRLGQIGAGEAFYVLSGPVCGYNSAWYQVYYRGISGWTMEGQNSTYWLEPVAS